MEVGQQSSILLIHAFLGCDTTSRIHNIGKGKVFQDKRLQAIFDEKSSVFYDKNAAKEDVKMEGEALMLSLFRKGTGKLRGDLRAKMFSEKVKNNNHVKPQSLPQQQTQPPCTSFVFTIKSKAGCVMILILLTGDGD